MQVTTYQLVVTTIINLRATDFTEKDILRAASFVAA